MVTWVVSIHDFQPQKWRSSKGKDFYTRSQLKNDGYIYTLTKGTTRSSLGSAGFRQPLPPHQEETAKAQRAEIHIRAQAQRARIIILCLAKLILKNTGHYSRLTMRRPGWGSMQVRAQNRTRFKVISARPCFRCWQAHTHTHTHTNRSALIACTGQIKSNS